MFSSWARGRLFDPEAGASQLRRAVTDYFALDNKNGAPTVYGLIADLEAMMGHADSALTTIDLALATAAELGEHWADSVLFRRKGEILLMRDTSAAEEAFRQAIDVANKQGARSYVLLASLALARLYRSTACSVDAHAALVPALEGFAPTPEMPQIAEAQSLLGELSNRQRRPVSTSSSH
jgi:hypothetical protein